MIFNPALKNQITRKEELVQTTIGRASKKDGIVVLGLAHCKILCRKNSPYSGAQVHDMSAKHGMQLEQITLTHGRSPKYALAYDVEHFMKPFQAKNKFAKVPLDDSAGESRNRYINMQLDYNKSWGPIGIRSDELPGFIYEALGNPQAFTKINSNEVPVYGCTDNLLKNIMLMDMMANLGAAAAKREGIPLIKDDLRFALPLRSSEKYLLETMNLLTRSNRILAGMPEAVSMQNVHHEIYSYKNQKYVLKHEWNKPILVLGLFAHYGPRQNEGEYCAYNSMAFNTGSGNFGISYTLLKDANLRNEILADIKNQQDSMNKGKA